MTNILAIAWHGQKISGAMVDIANNIADVDAAVVCQYATSNMELECMAFPADPDDPERLFQHFCQVENHLNGKSSEHVEYDGRVH